MHNIGANYMRDFGGFLTILVIFNFRFRGIMKQGGRTPTAISGLKVIQNFKILNEENFADFVN